MAAERKCCVPDCDKSREDGIVLHKFPDPQKDPNRFRTWTFAIGGNILTLDDNYVYKYRRICNEHFESRYWTWNKMLTKNATPTLHLKGFVVKRNALADVTNKNIAAKDTNILNSSTASTSGCLPSTSQLPAIQPTSSFPMPAESQDVVSRTDLKMKTSKKNFMTEQIITLKKEVKKLTAVKDNYSKRLKKALKLGENKTFLNALKSFTTMAAIFTVLQFREYNKKKMGRRFTQKEKVMALSIYKRGPRAYRLLSKIFVLPSPYTLSKMVSRAGIKPGLNENIFDQLKKRARKMKPDHKLCTLIFDEMAITPHFDYNKKKDKIIGFVDNGDVSKNQMADHVLVFMIRGIFKNYKQPICYTFCSGSTKKEELSILIKKIISKLHSTGFKVLATVCDQGSSNVSAINYLLEETRSKYLRRGEELRKTVFEVDDEEIIPLYDVPHLLKGIRNNLLNKDLKYVMDGTERTAKWDHVIKLHENNPTYKGIKLIKKLTEYHCNPNKIPKMKVKHAVQIFSHTVGVHMGHYADIGLLPKECRETADILIFFDELFDSMNGSFKNSGKRSGKPLLQPLTPNSKHQEVWNKSKLILKSMKFITKEGNVSVVPSIANWLRTIENMEILKNKLFYEFNLKSIWCRHLNQDPIENFFGSIRSHGYRNNSPTCVGFEAAFISLLVNNLSGSYSPGSNCEDDSCYIFKSLKTLFFQKNQSTQQTQTNLDYDHIYVDDIIVNLEIKKMDPRIMAPLEYVTGFILRQCHKNVFKGCKTCKNTLYSTHENDYIKIREYNKNKAYLTYPSTELIKCFSAIQDIVNYIIRKNSCMYNIQNNIKLILYDKLNLNFITCKDHKRQLTEKLFTTSAMFFLCNWCKDMNKILSGTNKVNDVEDVMQNLAYNYANKRKRK